MHDYWNDPPDDEPQGPLFEIYQSDPDDWSLRAEGVEFDSHTFAVSFEQAQQYFALQGDPDSETGFDPEFPDPDHPCQQFAASLWAEKVTPHADAWRAEQKARDDAYFAQMQEVEAAADELMNTFSDEPAQDYELTEGPCFDRSRTLGRHSTFR